MDVVRTLFRLLLGRRLPVVEGRLEAEGLEGPTTIARDRYGVVYLAAEHDDDAWFGLGFCQGQDRAFQIEQLTRIVRGTLSEWLGPIGLPLDRLSRRIGFRRAASAQMSQLDDTGRRMLESFAAGIRLGMTRGLDKKPHEFTLLRGEPTAFDAADSLGVTKLVAFLLASNWDVELARLKILREDGADALRALDPTYPEGLPVTAPPGTLAGRAADRLTEDLVRFGERVGTGGASNNWAIAPDRTAGGQAILANDPHLAPTLPPHWYLAQIRTPHFAVAGACFPATPAILAGHNDSGAWGVTAGFADNTDLYVEAIGPDGCSVREGEAFVACEQIVERIHVRGAPSVDERILVTQRGPIIGPALEGEVGAISMRATWLDSGPVTLPSPQSATSFEAFRQTFAQFPGGSLNMMYADCSGTIGWQLVGAVPERSATASGMLPAPGADLASAWQGTIPFEAMPYAENPDAGFLATANNQPVANPSVPFLGFDWIDGYRQSRITEQLAQRSDWDAASTRALQLDLASMPWREISPILRNTAVGTDGARKAQRLLHEWDGNVAPDSVGATIFQFFIVEMCRRVVMAQAPRSADWALAEGFDPLTRHTAFGVRRVGHLVRLLQQQPPEWFAHSWPDEISDALEASIRTLTRRFGPDESRWAWGRLRPLTLRHPIGDQPPFDRVFNLGPIAIGGDGTTIAQYATDLREPTNPPFYIPSLRMVIEVDRWDEATFALPGGQSGNPLSPHYADQLPLWERGEGIPIAWSSEAIRNATVTTLELVPKGPDA